MSDGVYKSRLKNARRNVLSGIIRQLVVIILNFAIRTAILYFLGAEYQGLSGLFTAILQVLNMTDLGFAAAVTFILYKPIAENDNDAICAIIAFLRKVYRIIGYSILCVGLLIMPFIPKLITGSYPQGINIYFLWLIYLLNAVVSYLLFAYKSTLLTALQRDDAVSKIYSITTLLSKSIQLILLFLFRNYYLYVLILPIGSIINNILLQIFSQKYFPELQPKGKIDGATKQLLVKQVKAVFMGRISDIARNSFDNIVLSSFMGLVTVAIYDNYYYIYSAVFGFMGIIAHSIQASVGNSLVKENVDKNYNDCIKFSFIFMWIVGWCSICMCCLYQPFMKIWMSNRSEMLLSVPNMLLFCLYFYAISLTYTKGVYLEAKGLFWECRKWYVLEAIGNLTLNIVLGYFWGVSGILIATIITIFVFNFLGGAGELFKHYFHRSPKEFYGYHICYFCVTLLNALITFVVCGAIQVQGVFGLAVRLVICIILPNIVYICAYYRTNNFRSALSIVNRFLNR